MASTNVLDTILWSLRNSDQAVREKALQSFEDYVRSSLASGKSDDGESFWDEVINKVLFPLAILSDTPQEKLVGIAAIDKLLRSPSDDPHPTTAPASATSNPSAASTSSTNPSAKRFLYRLLRFVKNLLPDTNLQVMTAAAKTYGTILQTGGPVFAETLIETEVQEAVRYMEEQATPLPNQFATASASAPGTTDGTGGYAEWTGAANRARAIANQTSKLLADSNASLALANANAGIKAGGLAAPPMLVIPSSAVQQQILSPATATSAASPLATKPSAGTAAGAGAPREKEKILAPHARIAGVLILIQIANYNPHMYYQYTKLVLSRILCPLRDGCRFWVVKGTEEDWMTSVDGLEGVADAGAAAVSAPVNGNMEDVLGARQMTASTGSLGGGSATPASTSGGKTNVEARDVVRRLAARLFRVTLRVMASREANLGPGPAGSTEDEQVDDGKMPSTGVTSPVAGSGVGLVRRASRLSASSSSMFAPPRSYSQVGGESGLIQASSTSASRTHGKGMRTSRSLVEVATAAANDLAAYLRVVMKGDKNMDAKKGKPRGTTSFVSGAPTSGHPLPAGNIHRAFGALLIFRELFESGLASLAGLYARDEDELIGSLGFDGIHQDAESGRLAASSQSRLMRGGIRYSEDGSAVEGSIHPRPAPQAGEHHPHHHHHQSGAKPRIKMLELPSEALAQPPPYTATFSAIFHLATRSATPASTGSTLGGGASLLSVGTESIARMLGGPFQRRQ
ncbi:hypothetical protein M408DRAFT_30067 [Serendipita vermifera MAFF 305830]|uniref:Uncharacterized protein n=1 Tax=Serendipita vermifera MAFF 305830 TaxID=933852 RepID=A0A0C2W2T5_SERVB|nr:hypothetical protein M408DRAFT_30067 [Serendipita vermifera MAFF 305830]